MTRISRQRRALIDPQRAADKPKAGEPPGLKRQSFGVDATVERAGTSHISIIDGDGNAVSMTTTIEGGFGSHNWAAGFLLNNELTDFSFVPVDAAGQPVANAVAPGKRPRSSMAPTIVFDEQAQRRSRARLARRQPHHPLRRQDAHRRCSTGGSMRNRRQTSSTSAAKAAASRSSSTGRRCRLPSRCARSAIASCPR